MFLVRSILLILFTVYHSVLSSQKYKREQLSTDFTNLKVNRTIDLSKLVIKIESKILIKSNKVDPIYSYRLPLLKNSSRHLINLSAKLQSGAEDEDFLKLKITKQNTNVELFDFYEVNFKSEPMNHEEERIIIITEEYFERLELLPKKIFIKQDQLVLLSDTINHVSFYPTLNQNVLVKLPFEKTELIEYTKKYGERKKEKIFYEIKETFAPLQIEKLRLHYIYNKSIGVLNYAVRTFEISHWGNIAVEEKYQVENIGAKLQGEFGRIDYDEYGRIGGKNSLGNLKATLPLKAFGLWFRDEIGNVTTSNAAREWDSVRLQLYPRFPILGGWKSNFNIGYNLPTKFHVSTDGKDFYSLNLTYGLPYNDIVAKNYTMRVVLPEGANNIKVNLPIDAKYQVNHEKTFSYLDYWGRPTLVISMKNVYDVHNVQFSITYKWSGFYLFWKPLLLILFFFALFSFLCLYFRLDFTLHKRSKVE